MFDGIRVIELAQWVFVPACGAVLADLGADVTKIEHPVTGDPYRGLMTQGVGAHYRDVNLNWEQNNRGKRSVGLDIRTDEGREIVYRLVRQADVFLTNFRPSTLARLGYDVADLREENPHIIYARGHAHGVRGPEANTPGYDQTTYWARGGFAHTLTPVDYEAPIGSRGAIGDKPSAMNLAFGVAAALFRRERTGEPAVVDVSLLGSAVWSLSSDILSTTISETLPDPSKTPNGRLPGYYTQDHRLIILSFLNDAHWAPFCEAIGRSDLLVDPRFNQRASRMEHAAAYEREIQTTFAARPYDEWCRILGASGAPWAPVQSAGEVARDPQVLENNYLTEVDSGAGYSFFVASVPAEFDGVAVTPERAPSMGQDTEDVMLELGFSWDEILELKSNDVLM